MAKDGISWGGEGCLLGFQNSTIEINNGAVRYSVVDENGKPTGETSTKYRDITGDEAMRLFGTTRTVRVGVPE